MLPTSVPKALFEPSEYEPTLRDAAAVKTKVGDALDRGQPAISHASDAASEMAEMASQQVNRLVQSLRRAHARLASTTSMCSQISIRFLLSSVQSVAREGIRSVYAESAPMIKLLKVSGATER